MQKEIKEYYNKSKVFKAVETSDVYKLRKQVYLDSGHEFVLMNNNDPESPSYFTTPNLYNAVPTSHASSPIIANWTYYKLGHVEVIDNENWGISIKLTNIVAAGNFVIGLVSSGDLAISPHTSLELGNDDTWFETNCMVWIKSGQAGNVRGKNVQLGSVKFDAVGDVVNIYRQSLTVSEVSNGAGLEITPIPIFSLFNSVIFAYKLNATAFVRN